MNKPKKLKKWKVISQFTKIDSPWLTLFGENLETNKHETLEYWRVEKPNGIIAITIQNNKIILPKLMYRPGVGKYTLDFCGGRFDNKNIDSSATEIVKRELGIDDKTPLTKIERINKKPWQVDSSFTNVYIFGLVAYIKPDVVIKNESIHSSYDLTNQGINKLLDKLTCLQCRAMLLEWLRQNENKFK